MNPSPIPQEIIQNLSRVFQFHAGIYQGNSSLNSAPMYAFIALKVAQDPEILALVEKADLATQVSNLLLAAVHDLLLGGSQDPLRSFYPDLTPKPRPYLEVYPFFRSFCLQNSGVIRHLVTTRRVQTNEIQRCACLLPAFCMVANRGNGSPLAIVEIGASAGLNLLWDRFSYNYGQAGQIGSPAASIKLSCTLLGERLPTLPISFPEIAFRVGIDLHPITLNDEAGIRWLRALIWPEHQDRIRRLDAALALAHENPPRVLSGDAVDLLPELLDSIPEDLSLCVYHSFTLNQMAKPTRTALLQEFVDLSMRRSFYRVSLEWDAGQEQPQLYLFRHHRGSIESLLLATCESHGRFMQWMQ